jgi:hypothetical protein
MRSRTTMNTEATAAQAPWYRHRWPWFLMAGPAIVVVAGFVTLWLAVKSFDGLVADDYYKQGLAINKTLARGERAAQLAIVAELGVSPDGAVTARIAGNGPLGAPPAVRVTFLQPARVGTDVPATLQRGVDGVYAGRVPPLRPGRWQIVVETDDWRLPSTEATAPFGLLTLRPDAPVE